MAAKVDPITLDIIENALKNARFEMDGVVVRISLSPVIREQHDEFPMICNERGQMVVGQFGSYIPGDRRAVRQATSTTATSSSGTTPMPAKARSRTTTTGA